MRRTAYLGLFLTLIAAWAAPGFAQEIKDPAEYKAYFETVYSEKDPAKKAAAGEKFLKDYPATVARTHTYMAILLSYYNGKSWPKALETADKQAEMAPTLSADDKKTVILVGFAAAELAQNTPKLQTYAERVLADDPKHTGALVTLSSILGNSVPTDFKKTLEITERALAAPRIAGVSDPQWNAILVQLHDTAAMAHLNQKKYAEAIGEAEAALKIDKKDGRAYYLMGMAMKPAVVESIAAYTAAVNKLNLPENRTADQVVRDELIATKDALDKVMTTKTDEIKEVFAKSVATGWQGAANPAHNELKAFNLTPAELDDLIQKMKAQI